MEYGCIGEKLSHSFSKEIHSRLFDYNYELKEIPKSELSGFMLEKNFKAINVTIPYKQDVIPFLDEISDTAKTIGAVNTIVNKNDKLYGYNTDFSGMMAMIKYNKIELNGKKVLILGSGGTSKTAVAVAKHLGARAVYRVSRAESNECITYGQAEVLHNDAEIIINATPCGMYPNIGNSAVDISKFKHLDGVIDAIYNPLRPALVQKALENGIKASGGLYMLVSQAVFAAEKFVSSKIDESKTEEIYNELFSEKENIVLVGMPGSGKTTIGEAAAKILNREFIDTDIEIVKRENKTISEIFSKVGEGGFRKIETEIVKTVSLKQGAVIATGGGAVLNPENISLLKENGKIYFIDRPIEQIAATDDRPLSSNIEMLKRRFAERYDIYKSVADITINAVSELDTNLKALIGDFKV